MKLIIGGAFQGKLEYAVKLTGCAKEDFLDGAACELQDVFEAKGIYHFQEYIRRCLELEEDCSELAGRLAEQNPDLVIISEELGYGIVPYEPFDRKYRETTGRVCTSLAALSSQVVRVVCGIGMVLKNDKN
ncbi:MAG: bifunctional adenosylcobinamide kinase/adenosylcobinamide-phosphate guanylyltransferase [Lachnospiraceae bacterium]|nr:bifunctional adenosylcobinamide kinase/adenosylcobinamide-phosphate guanylyltransferase [Lachnospiraceae bacterium]